MKLSAAIRVGGFVKKQSRGSFRDKDGGTCALGGALEAINASPKEACKPGLWFAAVLDNFPVGYTLLWHTCTLSSSGSYSVMGLIAHLNDEHLWSRDQIADFVEEIEQRIQADTGQEVHTNV